jgi:C4-dicarboxylate-specific signal transduction histidine kinase
VRGDTLLLHQAFLNILTNAEQAMTGVTSRRLDVHSWVSASGQDVITRIRDSGPGIPSEVLPRIFEPFYTTKEVGKGTGLGLAITYGIIQDHGGQIYAENDDMGTSFTIQLPIDERGVANQTKRL